MAAVLLACASAALFGAMAVAVRFAVRRFDDAELGSLAMSTVALALTGVNRPGRRATDLVLGDVWPFLVAGAIAPGPRRSCSSARCETRARPARPC